MQRGTPAATNELLTLLRSRQYPIFDLAHVQAYQDMMAWLETQIATDQWPTAGRTAQGQAFLADILQRLDAVLQDLPVSDADIAWFQEQLAARLHHRGTPIEGDMG